MPSDSSNEAISETSETGSSKQSSTRLITLLVLHSLLANQAATEALPVASKKKDRHP